MVNSAPRYWYSMKFFAKFSLILFISGQFLGARAAALLTGLTALRTIPKLRPIEAIVPNVRTVEDVKATYALRASINKPTASSITKSQSILPNGRRVFPSPTNPTPDTEFLVIGEEFLKSSENPEHIRRFLENYNSLPDMNSKLELIQGAIERLLKVEVIKYETGLSWIKTFSALCQTQKTLEDELRVNTLVNFGLRDLINKFSNRKINYSKFTFLQPSYQSLPEAASKLKTYREKIYLNKFRHLRSKDRESTLEKVDWCQEALLSSLGLGNSVTLDSFKLMIERTAELKENFEKIGLVRRKWYEFWRKSQNFNEKIFIKRLGKQSRRNDASTLAQTKTASIILLWHIKTNEKNALTRLFSDFRFSNKARKWADKQISTLVKPDSNGKPTLLSSNDLLLLHTLLKKTD